MFKDVGLVIYDLDGVLIDSLEAILKSFELTFREVGVLYDPELIKKRIGHSIIEIFEEVLPEELHGKEWELRDRYIKHFQGQDTKYTTLLPGVQETLRELHGRGIVQSVATNKTGTEADRILRHLGVRQYIDFIVGFMDVPNAKPAPDMILHTLEKLGVDPENAVFVDDTAVGLTAGVEAGVHLVGITTGFNTRMQIMAVNPDMIIDDIKTLLCLI